MVKNAGTKQGGQGDGVPKACPKQAAADSRGSRTCVCANTFSCGVAHAGGEGRINILPRYRPVGVAIPPVSREGGRAGLPARVSGRHVVRGTDSPHLSWKCAQVTGNAGENGQNSGEMGGSSAWTRPWAPECGDTLKALACDQRPI